MNYIHIIKIDFFLRFLYFFYLPRYIGYIRIEYGDDRRIGHRLIQIVLQRRQLSASKTDIICLLVRNFHARRGFRRQTRFKERMEKTN